MRRVLIDAMQNYRDSVENANMTAVASMATYLQILMISKCFSTHIRRI